MTECGLFLPWASKKFLENGGQIINRRVNNFSDLYGSYDIIVNCAGLEASTLCNDRKVVPIRGQVIKVHAPWIKMAYYGNFDTYIVPGFSGVTLGGCRNYQSFDLRPNEYDYNSIKDRCEELVPSLKTAKVMDVKVGLRPHRDPVRVESEFIDTSRGVLKMVHNYGHGKYIMRHVIYFWWFLLSFSPHTGGYGVTTAPGCAKHAAKCVRDVWTGYSRM